MIKEELKTILESLEDEFFSSKRLEYIKAFERISSRYRQGSGSFLQTEEERRVYLFTRLPGTFSAVLKVFEEIFLRYGDGYSSFLDVGAGPGTGMWAALNCFKKINSCFLLEKDVQFTALGKEIAKKSSLITIKEALFHICDLEKPIKVEPHDLVLLSYSIGEIREDKWSSLLESLWNATVKTLVIIEPGTPAGYLRLMKIREILIKLGGFLWAPCPHSLSCPLEKGDWCHFSSRVQRSALHRQLKSADLGYEDEKFSYLVFGKQSLDPFESRVIRRPVKHSGHVEFTLCQKKGIQKAVYSKKDKELYRSRKKLEWGDFF